MTTFFIIYSILTTLMLFGIGGHKVYSSAFAPALEGKQGTGAQEKRLLSRKQRDHGHKERKIVTKTKELLRDRILFGRSLSTIYFERETLLELMKSGKDFGAMDVFDFDSNEEVVGKLISDLDFFDNWCWNKFSPEEKTEVINAYYDVLAEYVEMQVVEINAIKEAESSFKEHKNGKLISPSLTSVPKVAEVEPTVTSSKDKWEKEFGELTDSITEEDAR